MEDALHCNSHGMVVGVDRFWVVRAAGWAEWLSGGEKGFDGFVSQNDAIDAIVATVQQILISSAQPVRHGGQVISLYPSFKLPRRGHFFAARSAKKRSLFSSGASSDLNTHGFAHRAPISVSPEISSTRI